MLHIIFAEYIITHVPHTFGKYSRIALIEDHPVRYARSVFDPPKKNAATANSDCFNLQTARKKKSARALNQVDK